MTDSFYKIEAKQLSGGSYCYGSVRVCLTNHRHLMMLVGLKILVLIQYENTGSETKIVNLQESKKRS